MHGVWVFRSRVLDALKKIDSLPLLVARLTLGIEFMSTGWGKLQHLDKVTAYFGELTIPMPALNARVASATELVCGALLFGGVLSRLASLPLVVTMLVAIATAKRSELDGVVALTGFLEWTYIVLLLVIAVQGPGAISLDYLATRRLPREAPPAPPTERGSDEHPATLPTC
jgi:putative oxidoreductase